MNSTSTVSVTLGVEAIEEVDHIWAAPLSGRAEPKQMLKPDLARQGWPFFNRIVFGNSTNKEDQDFQTSIKAVFLYGVETWRTTVITS